MSGDHEFCLYSGFGAPGWRRLSDSDMENTPPREWRKGVEGLGKGEGGIFLFSGVFGIFIWGLAGIVGNGIFGIYKGHCAELSPVGSTPPIAAWTRLA